MSEGSRKNGPPELPGDRKPQKRRKPERDREEDEDRPRKRRAKKSATTPIILAIVGVVAVLGIALGAYLIISGVNKRNQDLQRNNDLANPQNNLKIAPEADASYSPVDTWQRYENMSVKINNVKIGKVPAIVGDDTILSSNTLLSFDVHILNHDQTSNLSYKSWQWYRDMTSTAYISDEIGNMYGMTRLPEDAKIVDSIKEASIAPGEQAKDAIVFDNPKPQAKFLLVKLQGKALGVPKDFKFRIAVKDVPKS